jgi:hypothetical protein
MAKLERLAAAGAVLALVLAPRQVPAQDTLVYTFSEDEVEVIEGSPEGARLMENTLLIADDAIQLYLVESTHAIEQGHRQGFADFRDWYRSWEQQTARASNSLLTSIFGMALKGGLNLIFPGSGTFIDKLKEYSVAAYELAVEHLGSVPAGDVNQFLDRHERSVEAYLTGLLDVPQQFRAEHPDIMDAARWEFVFEKVGTTPAGRTPDAQLGPATRRMLAELGVPEPGSVTANGFRERVLQRQILGVFNNSEPHLQMHSAWERETIAQVSALRHIYPGQADRYCPVERRLHDFWRTPECRAWRPTP